MIKNTFITRISLAILTSASLLHAAPQKNVVVAWDIHGVLCSQPEWGGHNCRPNQQTLELVKKLHDRGVKQVIFSNISEGSMQKLYQKFPDLFSCFDWQYSLAKAEGIFTRKPHGKYMEKFLKRVQPIAGANEIIFFDDKASNVRAAREYCMDAYVFHTAAQATEILKQRQVL